MAGLAAESLKYDKVVGQSADLFTLQVRIFTSLTDLETANATQWAEDHNLQCAEIHKPEQASAQQRPAAESHSMGSKFILSETDRYFPLCLPPRANSGSWT